MCLQLHSPLRFPSGFFCSFGDCTMLPGSAKLRAQLSTCCFQMTNGFCWFLGQKRFLQNVTVCEYFLLQCPGRGAEGGILWRSKVAFLPSVLHKARLSVVDSCNLVWLLLLVPPSLGFCNCTWAWATFCLSRLLLFKLSFSHVCDGSDLPVSQRVGLRLSAVFGSPFL